MLSEPIRSLILAEQERQSGRFIAAVDLEGYLGKLAERAEILADTVGGRCRGLVAFYCNDAARKLAFITLVLVDPRDRGLGIGRSLVACVLDLARRRGFVTCQLEVGRDNEAARALYSDLGFRAVEERPQTQLLEVAL